MGLVENILNREDMMNILDNAYSRVEKRPALKIIPVMSNLTLDEMVFLVEDSDKLYDKYTLTPERLENNLYKIKIIKKTQLGTKLEGTFIADLQNTHTWLILTDQNTYFVHHVIEKLIDALYPSTSRMNLNYWQIRDFLNNVSEAYQKEKIITFYAIKREVQTEKGRDIQRQTLSATDVENYLLDEARSHRIWIEWFRFGVIDGNGLRSLNVVMDRRAQFKLFFGKFSDFSSKVIGSLINLSNYWKNEYNKARRELMEENVIINPLKINYTFNFDNDHFDQLIKKLGNRYIFSIIHAGNPYFMANICDRYYGSPFGVSIIGKTVNIVPLGKTQPIALWKMVEKIQEELGEGKISDI